MANDRNEVKAVVRNQAILDCSANNLLLIAIIEYFSAPFQEIDNSRHCRGLELLR
jgi:hypothetical protein